MTELPEPIVQAVKYTVNCLPEDGIDSNLFGLSVEYRGEGRWGVFRHAHVCLSDDGEWSYGYEWRGGANEPATDAEWDEYHAGREAWIASHRFDLDTALKLAKEAAPHVTVNGYTVADALRMREKAADASALARQDDFQLVKAPPLEEK